MHKAFPSVNAEYLKNDTAYPIMITKTGCGWFGLIIASLIAAYMSTIGTHLNWGASYLVNDFYRRFVNPKASDKKLKHVAIFCTFILMFLGGLVSLTIMNSATQAFEILLLSGAGTGAVYLLRWFWWRVNAVTEIVAMCAAFLMSIVMVFIVPEGCLANSVLDHSIMSLLVTVAAVSFAWVANVLVTKPENEERLREFYKVAKPGGPGWEAVLQKAKQDGVELESGNAKWDMPKQILCVFIGIITIYASLFAGGYFVLLKPIPGAILSVVAVASAITLFKIASKLKLMDKDNATI